MAWYTPLLDLVARPAPAPAVTAPREFRVDSVYNPLTGLGGLSDKGMVGRPNPYVQPLSLEELALLYEHNGISRRLVDIVPTSACRRGWIVPEMAGEDKRLALWSRIQEGMTVARLHGNGLGVLVTVDEGSSADLGWLRTPLDMRRIRSVQALQIFDANEFSPLTWDHDITSPTFRLPAEYSVHSEGVSFTIHASRTILFRGIRRPPSRLRYGSVTRMPDLPFLQAVWDEVRRLTETLQGGAILAAEIRESVLKIAELTNRSTSDDASALESRLSLFSRTKSMIGVLLLGEGETYENRSNPPTGFSELTSAAWEALAAVTGIPQVILMGSTPGGLNTDGKSSWEGFRQLVSRYQEEHRDLLEHFYTVLYSAKEGPTQGQVPDGWELVFAPLDEPDQQTVATTRASVAATDVQYINAGVYSAADVARSRFGPGGWSLDMLPVDPAAPQPALPAAAPAAAQPRADAAQSCWVGIPAAAAAPLRRAVEAAIGQRLVVETDPHVTVLFLGKVANVGAVAEAVAEEARAVEPHVIERGSVRAFPAGPKGTPIVIEFQSYPLETLNAALLRRLAHLISAPQHRRFRAHLTLGYAITPLSATAHAALLGIDASGVQVPGVQVEVRAGEEIVASVPLGA